MELFHRVWNQSESTQNSPRRVVLLHGMGGTGALWRPLAASLENEMEVLAPDQRGHGNSQIPNTASYSPLDYGQDVIDTLSKLGWHSSWIVGHSMGVRTAIATARLKPDWIQGLVLVDHGLSSGYGGEFRSTLSEFLKILPKEFPSRTEASDFMNTHCPDPSITRYLLAVSVKDSEGKITFPFDQAALIQTIQEAIKSPTREWVEELGRRSMPILMLRGAQSLVWSYEDYAKEKDHFASIPSVQFMEVENAGHGLPFEQRKLLAELIRTRVLGTPAP